VPLFRRTDSVRLMGRRSPLSGVQSCSLWVRIKDCPSLRAGRISRQAMNRRHSVSAVLAAALLACVVSARAADQMPLTSLRAIHALSNAEADRGIPVAFEATVTFYKKGDVNLFVQDGDAAIYVETNTDARVTTGDRVLVVGKTRASFRPEIKADNLVFLHHGVPPPPVPADFRQLIRAQLDCRRATVRAVVQSANVVRDLGIKDIYLQLLMDGGSVDAEMINSGQTDLAGLLDAEVEVTGAVAGKFDSKMQMTGIVLEVPSLADVKIIKRAAMSVRQLPITPMDEILKVYDIRDRTQRVRVQGSVTYFQPGSAAVLEDGTKSLWVETQFEEPMKIGELISATGFPSVHNGAMTLTRGEILEAGISSPVVPIPVAVSDLAMGTHAFDLVSVEGRLLMAVRESGRDEYVLVSNGHLFSAVYRHPEHGANLQPPPMKQVIVGSRVRMTGICILNNFDKFQGSVAFDVLLRSSDDIAVIAGPSPLNVRNLTLTVGFLLLAVLAVGARAWSVERRTRRQMANAAKFEQSRSLILEDINGSRPLAEILEQITAIASLKLRGAPCWCEWAEGERRGHRPEPLTGYRILETPIRARNGAQLGTIFAAFLPRTKESAIESETLSMASELAALSIETRRLYSDLRHRSDFDLLTDIHNRFSLEKRLDGLIDECVGDGAVFGLIYIDLDEFKLINDIYGHRVGDLYLQKVAQRMKHQLRPEDLLARIGGDEFAVLVPNVRGQEDMKEIATRLERCFDDLFDIDGNELRGSSSLGTAIYPLDGTTKDSLLNSADAAMYVAKHSKRKKTSPGDWEFNNPLRSRTGRES
jgi:diguanylate cyclase (GGDEF)-like protein